MAVFGLVFEAQAGCVSFCQFPRMSGIAHGLMAEAEKQPKSLKPAI